MRDRRCQVFARAQAAQRVECLSVVSVERQQPAVRACGGRAEKVIRRVVRPMHLKVGVEDQHRTRHHRGELDDLLLRRVQLRGEVASAGPASETVVADDLSHIPSIGQIGPFDTGRWWNTGRVRSTPW